MAQISVCPYCGTGCQIVVPEKDEPFSVSGYKGSPVNNGKLCIKGYTGLNYSFSKERLTYPLFNENGNFIRISWEDAIELAANKLLKIREEFGPDSVAFQSSAKCTNEENYLMQKMARVFGTNNIDHCARSCHSPTALGLINTLGTGAATGSIKSLEGTNTFFIIGSNTTEQHPIIGSKIISEVKKGKKLIVADPRKIKLAELADIHMQFRPGTDVALLNSLMFVIVKEKLYDKEFIDSRTEGFNELREEVIKYDPIITSEITGVEPELVYEAARTYATNRPSAIFYAMGITQHIHGTENVMNVSNLALITGNLGKYGSGIFPLRGQNNVQGSSDMGALAEFYPGYIRWDSDKIEKFAKLWNSTLPKKKGLTLSEMFDKAADGEIKAIYLMGENPLITEANIARVEEGIDNLEFFIVQDIFMTLTAAKADLVLPAASSLEKEGTFTNTERRIQRIFPIYKPPGEAKPDWWIINKIGSRMNLWKEYSGPEEIFNEIREAIFNYSGATYENIYPVGKQWPINKENPDGTEILHTRSFPLGKGKLVPIKFNPPSESVDGEYDLIMTTGRNYFHWHSGTMTRLSQILEREAPEPYIEINSEDAYERKIRNGQLVNVKSRHGEIRIRAKVTNLVPKGIVFIPFHYKESRVNLLVGENLDPISKIPEFKVVAVKVMP